LWQHWRRNIGWLTNYLKNFDIQQYRLLWTLRDEQNISEINFYSLLSITKAVNSSRGKGNVQPRTGQRWNREV
jgi:hypothetical protein